MKTTTSPDKTVMMCETPEELKAWVNDNVTGSMMEGTISTTACKGVYDGLERLYTEAVIVVKFSNETKAQLLERIAAQKVLLQSQMQALETKENDVKGLMLNEQAMS